METNVEEDVAWGMRKKTLLDIGSNIGKAQWAFPLKEWEWENETKKANSRFNWCGAESLVQSRLFVKWREKGDNSPFYRAGQLQKIQLGKVVFMWPVNGFNCFRIFSCTTSKIVINLFENHRHDLGGIAVVMDDVTSPASINSASWPCAT